MPGAIHSTGADSIQKMSVLGVLSRVLVCALCMCSFIFFTGTGLSSAGHKTDLDNKVQFSNPSKAAVGGGAVRISIRIFFS